MPRKLVGVALIVFGGHALPGCFLDSGCPPLKPSCSGDSVVTHTHDDTTDCGLVTSWETPCGSGETCRDGACVPKPPKPKVRCPNGGDGECRLHEAFRCEGGFLTDSPQYCPAFDTECLLVPAENGHVQAVCSLSSEPCQSVSGVGAECQGNTRVSCAHGYPVEQEACDGPNERCVVADPASAEGSFCALELPCPPAGSTACDADRVYSCDDAGIARTARDCQARSHSCTEASGQGLCSVSASGPREAVFHAIPGGTFQMARTAATPESPPLTAEVTDFEMTETEITVAEYAACVAKGECTPADESCRYDFNDLAPWLHGDLPVTCVSWSQALEYCGFVGGQLPTEIQWEYALRNGGRDAQFPWGEEEANCLHAILTQDDGLRTGCARGEPWPGCSRADDVTEQGVCDLVGNVEEWVIPVIAGGSGIRGGSYQSSPYVFDTQVIGDGRGALQRGFRCVRLTASL